MTIEQQITWTVLPNGIDKDGNAINEGDFQICVMEIGTGRTLQISEGPGAHENPTWSPDGTKVAWEVTRGSSTQIAVANADGSAMRIVTSAGNNFSPVWIKTLE
jgi:Tol biopolymer transport system component